MSSAMSLLEETSFLGKQVLFMGSYWWAAEAVYVKINSAAPYYLLVDAKRLFTIILFY